MQSANKDGQLAGKSKQALFVRGNLWRYEANMEDFPALNPCIVDAPGYFQSQRSAELSFFAKLDKPTTLNIMFSRALWVVQCCKLENNEFWTFSAKHDLNLFYVLEKDSKRVGPQDLKVIEKRCKCDWVDDRSDVRMISN